MSELDDTRLEREIGEILRRRDPGPAPIGLRDRVARVPETTPAGSNIARRVSRAIVPVLGLAAVFALLVLATPLLAPRRVGPVLPGPAAGTSTAPAATFAPRIQGPGIIGGPSVGFEGLAALALLAGLTVVVFAIRAGPRRGFAAIAGAVVLVWAGAQVAVTHVGAGPVANWGGIGVTEPPAGSPPVWPLSPPSLSFAYITAGPGEPFSFAFSVSNDGPLPIHIDGVVGDPAPQASDRGPTYQAVWRDSAPDVGMTGPIAPSVPFAGADLQPGEYVAVWVVGAAGQCAQGTAFFDSSMSTASLSYPPTLQVRYNVFGIPRTATIDLPFQLLEPERQAPGQTGGCPPLAQP